MDDSELLAEPEGGITVRIKKSYFLVALALGVGFGGGFGVAKLLESPVQEQAAAAESQASAAPAVFEVDTQGDPFLGPGDAPVTIVEFTDYQCPFCLRHNRQTLPQLLSNYGSNIKYVARNFPIASIHPDAVGAAVAAECAYEQGRFWEYHDLLFQNQDRLGAVGLKEHASLAGLDADEFGTCLESAAALERVARDFQDGQSYGVSGTPTFFINGRRLVGARPLSAFQAIIDEALAKRPAGSP